MGERKLPIQGVAAGPALSCALMESRSLEDLEGRRWGPPPPDSTFLVRRCHELRTKPLAEFSVEDLRIMIGQEIGLSVLAPRARSVLDEDPLAQGDFYRGDLLAAVVRASTEFWADHPDLRGRVAQLLERVEPEAIRIAEEAIPFRGDA